MTISKKTDTQKLKRTGKIMSDIQTDLSKAIAELSDSNNNGSFKISYKSPKSKWSINVPNNWAVPVLKTLLKNFTAAAFDINRILRK